MLVIDYRRDGLRRLACDRGPRGAGHRIRVLARSPERVPVALAPFGVDDVETAIGDVTDPAAVERALEGCDAVLHAASVFSMDARRADEMRGVNVRGTDARPGASSGLSQARCAKASSTPSAGWSRSATSPQPRRAGWRLHRADRTARRCSQLAIRLRHPRGMMKEAMVKKSGEMTFWPVTLKHPDQLELEVGEAKPYPTLQQHLREKYAGQTLTFEELLNDDYPSGDAWVESHYRWAVKGMAEGDEPEVLITRKVALTPKGRPARSLTLPAAITFL
jgi:hypothetical protein